MDRSAAELRGFGRNRYGDPMHPKKIGFIGTGIMGGPMARHLAERGHTLRVYNRSAEKAMALAQYGADVAATPADAATDADVLITMVSDADALRAVMEGPEGALSRLPSSAAWIQCGTVGLEALRDCRRWSEAHGAPWVDAPVLGTRAPAEAGKLTVLASGPSDVQETVSPVLQAFAARVLWVGEAGAGTRLKLVANTWVLAVNGALAEVFSLGQSLGVPPTQFLEAIEGGPLDCGYAHAKGKLMIEDRFPASFPLRLALKDARLIQHAGANGGARLDQVEGVVRALARAVDDGLGDEDMAAVFRATRPTPDA